MKHLTEEEFDELYTIVPDGKGETIRPAPPNLPADDRHVWTVVEGDSGSLYAMSGPHAVNRIGYLVTEEPWAEDTCADF